MALTREDLEIIAQVIEEEVDNRVLSALQEFATSIKDYIEESISENNSAISNHINDMLSEINISNSNQLGEDLDEEEDEELVNEQRQDLRESIKGMFEKTSVDFRDNSNGESLKFKSTDLVRNQNITHAELKSMMPPDEGTYYDTDSTNVRTKSVLDVATAIPDPSVANALTKDYSGLMKKLNEKK